ncbi:dynein light chain binding protein [Aureococcus anophagefferens]|nr:dynein light chain binding protein [Aureococcus anophagefferens]
MALQARHRYIVSRINEAFKLDDEEMIEELIRKENFISRINAFFRANGPTRIFIFCEKLGGNRRSTPEDAAALQKKTCSHNDDVALYYSDGSDLESLPSSAMAKVVYFMKRPGKERDDKVALDPLKAQDGALFFGTIGQPLQSLEAMLRTLYSPMLASDSRHVWGASSDEHKNEFMVGVEGFVRNVQENIKSLGGGLELQQPNPDVADVDAVTAAADPAIVTHYIELLEEWCASIEVYLGDTDRSRWETTDSGPATELEYWRRRMQRLTSITDQLKTKRCKQVIVLLTSVTKQPEDAMINRNHILGLMRRWRQIDVCITKAANEAKDNSKFLSTLERFLDPLQSGTPETIVDSIPALMNGLKMVHTISRFFNTTERMTKLFMKITNQMIQSCKLAINGKDSPQKLWSRPTEPLLETLESCLRLNEFYQEQYRVTKDKLLTMPKGRQFDFAEAQIFGKFDLFCRRVIKLIDMFSTIQQFHALVDHKLEGMEPLLVVFDQIIVQFKEKRHDLLDYHSNKFDRDYVEFNVRIGELETSLQHFINRSFESISSIEQSLSLLKKYQSILHRENLRSDLDSKFMIIFHNYGLELASVQETYENHKHSPPTARNMPPVAGNITWARHLLRRIEDPMSRFQSNSAVLASKESKRIVRTYNKVARTLIAFEYLWYEACQKLFVNFDAQVLQLIREAKCLTRMGIDIPEESRMVLSQEDRFKGFYNELKYALSEYDRVCGRIQPQTASVLSPHLQTLECKLRPGMVTLTWTSMNISTYQAQVHLALQQLEDLITKINDLVENRIEKNLKIIARTILVDLPEDKSVTLDEFVSMQELAVREQTEMLVSKNLEVETAVEDLIAMLKQFPLDPSALLNCARNSLNQIKKRVCARGGTGFLFVQRPFFEVDVQLSVPSVRLSPSLEDVQRAINRSAVAVLGCAKRMWDWGQLGMPDERKRAFFDRLGRDTEIIKVALLLTGALHATRNQVAECLGTFKKYDWLWKDDKDLQYRKFVEGNPTITDYDVELRRFMEIEREIERIPPMHNIGALTLNTANLKLQLRAESRQWKIQYSAKVHQQAREAMYIRVTTNKLHVEVKDLDSLRFVMTILREIRERESCSSTTFPGGLVDKDEMDQKTIMRPSWRKLVDMAEGIADTLSQIQGQYKKQLILDVREFVADCRSFRSDFEDNGPQQPGIPPQEAVERLRRYKDELGIRERKMEMYVAGEELFALRTSKYPELLRTRKEVGLLDQLYSLYLDVIQAVDGQRSVLWSDVPGLLQGMIDETAAFDLRCRNMPKRLREWPAYTDLRTKLTARRRVEEICEGADKQLGIETKLNDLRELWARNAFTFSQWKGRDVPILSAFGQIIDDLEEAQLNLQTLLSMRHVTPFREAVTLQLTTLSDTTDTLELWIKVQLLWTSLESVFMGGDIAKQMPLEAKKFAKIDRDFVKIMIKARGDADPTRSACSPTTREKVFDSVNQVTHDRQDKGKIVALKNISGSDEEIVKLATIVQAAGSIEVWLGALVKEMQRSLKALCEVAAAQCAELPLAEFIDSNCAQFALLGIQFNWTAQCQEALDKSKSSKGIVGETNKQQLAVLQELSSWCLTDLKTKMNRRKIETLVTIHVHQRDVFADLARIFKERKQLDSGDFEWLKQARFYWRNDARDLHGNAACVVSICDIDFQYNFEYLGCKERLVITPLTDRCYITLSQALGMHLGGAPAGPAGTGKTETVKDLGRALGVTNCTDQQRYTDMAKIFKGLCQAGLWGCFDEFNRIELPVLSVVAQQVLAITNGKRVGASTFTFPGDSQVIQLNLNVGYFITMNPGYAGRQELPENLKVLFRSVSMMVPDREIIMKQLSKQKHYDFGLRNILSVLRTAGQTKRDNPEDDEDLLIMRTLRDMNLSKFVAQDVPLFLSLLGDLFPAISMPSGGGHGDLQKVVSGVVDKYGLIKHPSWNLKVVQLYETTLVRHGIMMVGPPGSGKSTIIKVLQDALTATTGVQNKRVRMNPKAIRAEEMFGETDRLSGEWLNGIFASIWSKFNDRSRKDNTWIICDGPVDAVWIENLNTVLDDNKILTLANGDRIPMADTVKLMFEVEDLRNASPATVSRAGIIFVSASDLDWEPVLQAWLGKQAHGDMLRGHFSKYLGSCKSLREPGIAFEFLRGSCGQPLAVTRVGSVENTLVLLSALLKHAELSESQDDADGELERLVLFAITWGIAGLLEAEDRAKLCRIQPLVWVVLTKLENFLARSHRSAKWDAWLREGPAASANTPREVADGETIFEYAVNMETMEWERWSPATFKAPRGDVDDWSSVLVPTMETCRSTALMKYMQEMHQPVLLVGGSGTAKTSNALTFFDTFNADHMLLKKMNFSSATTPGMFQQAIEAELDKQGGKNFGPPGGKKMTFFLDDLSMPEVNVWGDQPTLELVRQLIETSGVCFLDKDKRGDFKNIEKLHYVAAMDLPGGGKNDVPNRIKRHFFTFTIITPSEATIESIYGQLLGSRFNAKDFGGLGDSFQGFVERMPATTMALFKWMRAKMLPSPTKFHYTFTLRDLSRLFQGVLRTPKSTFSGDHVIVQLWRHEAERVFADKLVSLADARADKDLFATELDSNTATLISPPSASGGGGASADNSRANTASGGGKKGGRKAGSARGGDSGGGRPGSSQQQSSAASLGADIHDKCMERAHFVDFLRDDEYDEDGILVALAPKIYEVGGPLESLRERTLGFLGRYNEEHPGRKMSLIIFDDALLHLIRISRVLGMPRGNMMLVGVGGSGKQSLTHLAAYMAGAQPFQISLTKTYNLNSFLDDLRMMYKVCGQQRRKATFIFTDAQIKDENFLELLNSLLMTGEISGLFPKDELQIMAGEIRQFATKRPDYSDTPDFLSSRTSSTRWPSEALIAVSEGFIGAMEIQCEPETKKNLMQHMAFVHHMIVESCDEYYMKMRRRVYQTPRSYLSFLADYQKVYAVKLGEIEQKASRVQVGLEKLQKGAEDVESMKLVLADEEVKLQKANEATTEMLGKLQQSSMEAKKEADAVGKIKESCVADAKRIAGEKAEAEKDLAKAQPFVEEAERAVNSIKPNDLNELKKLQKPSDIIKLIFDVVGILKMEKLNKVELCEVTMGIGKEKRTFQFVRDSYKLMQGGLLSDARFLQNIFYFSKYEKDFINDETIELMAPYVEIEEYNTLVARNASKAAEGLCAWSRAMGSYHEASKIVKPKLEALRIAEARLADAQRELDKAEAKLQACMDVLAGLQADFEAQMAKKEQIEAGALATRKKMEQATALIGGLGGERARWTEDSHKFDQTKKALVGDVAIGCAFVSYCGPFNQEFRDYIVHNRLTSDLKKRAVPCSPSLDIIPLLVDVGEMGDWNLEGLPTDPPGQALNWIKCHEEARLPTFGPTSLNNPRLRDQVEFTMAEGRALIVTGIEEELDPMLDPVLQKQVIVKGKSKYINITDKLCEYQDEFMLYLTTRLPNPTFSPEDQAKTTVVDFTVTMKGLEEQLLGRVIQKEQRSLEEQLNTVLEEVSTNTKALLRLDELLLERLSANSGNLLDDEELIAVLAETKTKALEVNDKLNAAATTRESINDKREQYRPAATARLRALFYDRRHVAG